MKKTVTLCLFLLATLSLWSQKVNLSLNLVEGESYALIDSGASNSTIIFDNDSIHQFSGGQTEMQLIARSVGDNSNQLEAKFMRLGMSYGSQGASAELTSDSSRNDAEKFMQLMVGRPYHVELSHKGKVEEIVGVDSILSEAMNLMTDLPPARAAQTRSQIEQVYNGKYFADQIEMSLDIFPDRAIQIGDVWQVDRKRSLMGANLSDQTEYTLVKVDSTYIYIKGTGELLLEFGNDFMGLEWGASSTLKGSLQSEIKLDRISLWIEEASAKQLLQGFVDVIDPDSGDSERIEMILQIEKTTYGN